MSRFFDEVNEEYLEDLLRTYDSKSTTLCVKKSVGLFNKFLISNNIDDKADLLPLADLNRQLNIFIITAS